MVKVVVGLRPSVFGQETVVASTKTSCLTTDN